MHRAALENLSRMRPDLSFRPLPFHNPRSNMHRCEADDRTDQTTSAVWCNQTWEHRLHTSVKWKLRTSCKQTLCAPVVTCTRMCLCGAILLRLITLLKPLVLVVLLGRAFAHSMWMHPMAIRPDCTIRSHVTRCCHCRPHASLVAPDTPWRWPTG